MSTITAEQINQIAARIRKSKKYHDIYPATITDVVTNLADRYKPSQVEKMSKTQLHQIWELTHPAAKLDKLITEIETAYQSKSQQTIADIIQTALQTHPSTRERISYSAELYQEIFSIIPTPAQILDVGCGFNPLTLPMLKFNHNWSYLGIDLNQSEIIFLNKFLQLANLPTAVVHQGDVLIDQYKDQMFDAVFLFKVMPTLIRRSKTALTDVLQKINAKYFVITYPLHTLSGRNVGMQQNYTKQFTSELPNQFKLIHQRQLPSELLYIATSR